MSDGCLKALKHCQLSLEAKPSHNGFCVPRLFCLNCSLTLNIFYRKLQDSTSHVPLMYSNMCLFKIILNHIYPEVAPESPLKLNRLL